MLGKTFFSAFFFQNDEMFFVEMKLSNPVICQ